VPRLFIDPPGVPKSMRMVRSVGKSGYGESGFADRLNVIAQIPAWLKEKSW
jgi:hypothetical protein